MIFWSQCWNRKNVRNCMNFIISSSKKDSNRWHHFFQNKMAWTCGSYKQEFLLRKKLSSTKTVIINEEYLVWLFLNLETLKDLLKYSLNHLLTSLIISITMLVCWAGLHFSFNNSVVSRFIYLSKMYCWFALNLLTDYWMITRERLTKHTNLEAYWI